MLSLRYAAAVAIALWVAGLVVLAAIAAPSIFDELAARNVADGRALAGGVVGEMLGRFHVFSYGCAAVLVGSLLLRRALGPRPRRFGVRLGIALVMTAATVYAGVVLTPRIDRARAGGAPSALAESDTRRAEFVRLHRQSTVLLLVPVVGGLILFLWELRD